MAVPLSNHYDAIIIGAGIGGLVCAAFLAKAGMKTLVVEQHTKPGGYCTSFRRKGFLFDAAAHSFGSYREEGNMFKVIKGLDLETRLKIKRNSPSDIVILPPNFKITFSSDRNKTLLELQKAFPHEAENIRNFFQFLTVPKKFNFADLRKKTFKDFLSQFFKDSNLKAIISLPVLGNGALSPALISAFTGANIFSEFILDGGYYPTGGMQTLADILVDRFEELGGEIRLSCTANKVKVNGRQAEGIIVNKREFIPAKYVISNCDVRQTFFQLIGKQVIGSDMIKKINTMIPSLSTFILYLGIDKPFGDLPKPGTNVWLLSDNDLEKAYYSAKKGNLDNVNGFMVRFSPDKKTLLAFIIAPFKSERYWEEHKQKELEAFIRKIEKFLIPNLSEHILYKDAATPYTLYRYTHNYKGAAYGWASLPSQLFIPEFRQRTFIKGLYLTGHWTTHTQGIPGVAYLGYSTAQLILRREKSVQE